MADTLLDRIAKDIDPVTKEKAKLQLELAKEIERLLEKKNWNRSKLGEESGKGSSYVTKLLKGEVNCTLETIAALRVALNEYVLVAPWLYEDEKDRKLGRRTFTLWAERSEPEGGHFFCTSGARGGPVEKEVQRESSESTLVEFETQVAVS